MLKPGVWARSRDTAVEEAEKAQAKIVEQVSQKVVDISKFRNEKGEFLMPFSTMFPKKSGKNIDTGARGGRA